MLYKANGALLRLLRLFFQPKEKNTGKRLHNTIDYLARKTANFSFFFHARLHSGKYWQLLAHNKSRFYSNLGPKKLIFCNFGAVFSHFSDFGAKFSHIFNFSRPKWRENLNFWASKLVQIYFCTNFFCGFFMRVKKWSFCPLCLSETWRIEILA